MATNLEFIKSETLNGANTYSITDVFSDKYDVYQIIIQGLDHNVASREGINARLINSSGISTSANYDYAQLIFKANTSFAENRATNDTKWLQTLSDGYGRGNGMQMFLYNPFDSSSYTFCTLQQSGYYDIAGPGGGRKYIGAYKVAESITGINFYDNGLWTLYNGKISIFGVK